MGFADSIRTSGTKIKQQVNDKVTAIAVELFNEVVKETPVDKGVLKNNYYVGYGRVYSPAYNANSASNVGMASLTQIASLKTSMTFLGKDGAVNMTNNTPYAYRAEYLGWPTPKWTGMVGPYAMVAKAFIVVAPKYKRP